MTVVPVSKINKKGCKFDIPVSTATDLHGTCFSITFIFCTLHGIKWRT